MDLMSAAFYFIKQGHFTDKIHLLCGKLFPHSVVISPEMLNIGINIDSVLCIKLAVAL